MRFAWDESKNSTLKAGNRPGFEVVPIAYEQGAIFFEGENVAYPGQGILVIILNDYAHVVPFEDRGDHLFLRTIYPSRKWQRIYKEQTE